MRYPLDHKSETRQRLVNAAGSLAKKNGFATTGVNALMASVNLTGGAFYSHFESKDDLLNEIILKELKRSHKLLTASIEENPVEGLKNFSAYYLSLAHVHHPEFGCALATLSNEVARADNSIKQTYQKSVQDIQQVFANTLQDENAAWATMALNVGAIMLARAMATPEVQQQLLDSCKQFANTSLQAVLKQQA